MRFKVKVCSLDNIRVSEIKWISWDWELMDNLNKEFFLINFAIFYTNLIPQLLSPNFNFWEIFLKVTVSIVGTFLTFLLYCN